MPLTLDGDSLDRLDDRPLYKQLADRIRSAIQDGDLNPGDALPSETEIGAAVVLSRYAVRDALDVLVTEGLIVKQRGTGTRVAPAPRRRNIGTSRYQDELNLLFMLERTGEEHPETSAFTVDYGIEWKSFRVQTEYQVEPADDIDAEHLRIAPGTPVLRRRLLKHDRDGEPAQIQVSVMELSLVEGTPVADPARQPWKGGTLNELFSVAQVVRHVSERARSRKPTAEERRALRMEAQGDVLDMLRVFSVGTGKGRHPVEYSTVVVAAAGTVLEFETELQVPDDWRPS